MAQVVHSCIDHAAAVDAAEATVEPARPSSAFTRGSGSLRSLGSSLASSLSLGGRRAGSSSSAAAGPGRPSVRE
jgi:hypothetical protein